MKPIVLREFPLIARRSSAPRFLQQFGRTNMIVDAVSSEVSYAERRGPLSIKSTFAGRELHSVGSDQFMVDPANYLVLNGGQRYASEIKSTAPVESFTVFLAPQFAQLVLTAASTAADRLLDEPQTLDPQPLDFHERLYRHDTIVTPALRRLRMLVRTDADVVQIEEQMSVLLSRLLNVHRSALREVRRLQNMRLATRLEVYRRLLRGRAFIEDNFTGEIDLESIAQAACLSPYHFLRLFKQAFDETPHEYLTRRRLEAAPELLLKTQRSILEICLSVGFHSASSFGRLFRSRFAISPAEFRRA